MIKTKEQIGQMFLDRFVELNARPDYTLDQAFIDYKLGPRLNPKEQDLIGDAVEYLEARGFVTTNDSHGWHMVLTQKGFDHIFN